MIKKKGREKVKKKKNIWKKKDKKAKV